MNVLLGALLVRWNFITLNELDAGLSLSQLTNLPLGKSLCALNLLSEEDVRSSVQVQAMLQNAMLSETEADRIMHLCRVKKLSLSQALKMTGLISLSGQTVKLGQLLVDSGCLEQSALVKPLQISRKTCLPLGVVLVSCKLIDSGTLETVLRYQRVQRFNREALDLQTLKHQIAKVQDNSGVDTAADRRLGSVLHAAGIITKTQLNAALEISLTNRKMLGEILIQAAWIKQQTLDAALLLQKAIRTRQTDSESALQLLTHVHNGKIALVELTSRIVPTFIRKLSFAKFLVMSGLIEREQLQAVKRDCTETPASAATSVNDAVREDPIVLRDAICRAGISTISTMGTALKYWQLACTGSIPLVTAIALLAEHLIHEEQMLLQSQVPVSLTAT